VKDCLTDTAPNLDNPSTYENNATLSCLGEGALDCQNTKGVLKSDFFPTVFEIVKTNDQGVCNFKISYPTDDKLNDINGQKLAGQYITCPISAVKMLDNTDPAAPKFTSPDKTNFSKYGSQIYFYGTVGLFIENNLDTARIKNLGCSGGYIDSMVASYNVSHSQ
jgi:hypothetical protein